MDFDSTREYPLNHTYKLNIEIGNLSPNQRKNVLMVLTALENEGANILKEETENDWQLSKIMQLYNRAWWE